MQCDLRHGLASSIRQKEYVFWVSGGVAHSVVTAMVRAKGTKWVGRR